MPHRIGIITSPAGAVIQDMLHVLERRFPGLHIRLYPTAVQGEGSAQELVRGLEYFSENPWAEVVILARGGGSLEDLWSFNEEVVARAIAASNIPVISAVGHQTDFTIADFVADLRAPTPSAAAELAVPVKEDLIDGLDSATNQLNRVIRGRLDRWKTRSIQISVDRPAILLQSRFAKVYRQLDDASERAFRTLRGRLQMSKQNGANQRDRLQRADVRLRLAAGNQRLAVLQTRLRQAMDRSLTTRIHLARHLQSAVTHLSPTTILERGYAIVQLPDGQVVRRVEEAGEGQPLQITLSNGHLGATSGGPIEST
jgi:exodeoxyribonuclease VII large subunit